MFISFIHSTTACFTLTDCMFLSFSVDEPLQFVTKLKDNTSVDGETFTFTCEVTKDNVPAKWYKNYNEISPSDKHEMKCEGPVHSLTVHDLCFEDEDEYTIVVEDTESTAFLIVEEPEPGIYDICMLYISG